MAPRVLVIDNYDSFVYNLVQYLGELGAEPVVHRHDALAIDALVALEPDAVLVSPGPGDPGTHPEDAGVSNDAIRVFGSAGIPVLGVCLGHQCIGKLFGGEIVRAPQVMHGKTSQIAHDVDVRALTSSRRRRGQRAVAVVRSRNDRTRSWPCAVRIDSGWNCTPSTSSSR